MAYNIVNPKALTCELWSKGCFPGTSFHGTFLCIFSQYSAIFFWHYTIFILIQIMWRFGVWEIHQARVLAWFEPYSEYLVSRWTQTNWDTFFNYL